MSSEVVMPRLSDSMEEGTILTWLKRAGDEVSVGDELVEIETDKASMVYEADASGRLEILAGEGETIALGAPIARLGDGSATPDESPESGLDDSEAVDPGKVAQAAPVPVPGTGSDRSVRSGGEAPGAASDRDRQRAKASPLARRIARERGVDLTALEGSGPGGRIVKQDVVSVGPGRVPGGEGAALPPRIEPEEATGAVETIELSRLQQTVARRMAESKAAAPHFYLRTRIDMDRCLEARRAFKAALAAETSRSGGEAGPAPSINDFVIKACALALRAHPRANGSFVEGRFELYSRVNVGFAVAARDALVVPAIPDSDGKSLRQIAAESRRLAARVRDGSITPPELAGATFTVSNLGMFGIQGFDAVINPPQAAILAVGGVTEQPVSRGGQIESASLMEVSLACDHRILYGADAAEFLARIKRLLEDPALLA